MNLDSTLLFFICFQTCLCHQIYNGTELVHAVLIHRHGDRAPTIWRAAFSNNPNKLKELVQPYGYGQITSTGLQRSYKLGEFIRQRYGAILSPSYNESEILFRATEYTRVQMSAQAVMAALYRPGDNAWKPGLNWTPTPYKVLPKNLDYNMGSFSCPKYADAGKKLFNEDFAELHEYDDVLKVLADEGHNFTTTPAKILLAYDTFVAQLGLGLPLSPQVEKVYPRLKTAAEKAFDVIYRNEDSTTLISGPVLSEFFQDAENLMAGKPTLKMRVLSGHDINVYSLAAVSRAMPAPRWPGYASLFALELRKILKTGKFVVLPIYLASPEEDVQYLQIENCASKFCDIDIFKNLTSKYTLNETEWRIRCGINATCLF